MTALGVDKTIRLGIQLGDAGGEGIVHAVEGRPDLAAKLYYPDKRAFRRDKILAMVKAGFHSKSQLVAFPVEVLADDRQGFLGFTMRRFDDHRPVHELYGMQDRWIHFPQATFPFLVRSAENVARAVASVHDAGCVVGDISHSNVLISPKATAALVDSDSFQVIAAGGRTFLSGVGTLEFLPPELHGRHLDEVLRTENHDLFSLAVLIFQLLFLGRHPFHGRYRGPGDCDPEHAIRDFRFAYSTRRRDETLMDPPPGAPSLEAMDEPVAEAFEKAFGPDGATNGRPRARDWVSLLEAMERDLAPCRENATHHHSRRAGECPWCRIEQHSRMAVFPLSPASLADREGMSSLDALRAAIDDVSDPGEIPDLERLVAPEGRIRPSFRARRRQTVQWTRRFIWVFLLVAGLASAALQKMLSAPWSEGWVLLVPAVLLAPQAWGIPVRNENGLWLGAWIWAGIGALLVSFSAMAGVIAAALVGVFSFLDGGGWWRLPLAASIGVAGFFCLHHGVTADLQNLAVHVLSAVAVTVFGLVSRERHRNAGDDLELVQALADADAEWRSVLRRWRKQANTTEFLAMKTALHGAADRLGELAEAEPALRILPDKAERRRRLIANAHDRTQIEAQLRRGPETLRSIAADIEARRRAIPPSYRQACLALLQARADQRAAR